MLSKLPKCILTRYTLNQSKNQFFYNIARRRMLSSKKKSLLHLCRVYQVNVFYPKTINKQQDKNGRETFRDQILIQKIVNFLSRCEKRTSFLRARDHVVDAWIVVY